MRNDSSKSPQSPEHPESQAAPLKIILADTQAIYRVGTRKIFALEDDIRVIAQCESLEQLLAAISKYPTSDMILMEHAICPVVGDAVTEVLKVNPTARIVVQVTEVDEDETVDLYRRGVKGIIDRTIAPDLLVKCVRRVAAGETWIDNQSVNWVIDAYRLQAQQLTSPRNRPHLSEKELNIIAGVTQGLRNKEIAYNIGTTEQVVKNYLRKVYDKLGVSDRLELALYCIHHQLLKKPDGQSEAQGSGQNVPQPIRIGSPATVSKV